MSEEIPTETPALVPDGERCLGIARRGDDSVYCVRPADHTGACADASGRGLLEEDTTPDADDETTEANEPGWTGVGAASSGIGPVQQCSSRSPRGQHRCVRELGHVGTHMRNDLRWQTTEPCGVLDPDPHNDGRGCTLPAGHEPFEYEGDTFAHAVYVDGALVCAWNPTEPAAAFNCSSVSPHGDACTLTRGHGVSHERHQFGERVASWVDHNPGAPTRPRMDHETDLAEREARAMLMRILGAPCHDAGCPFHGNLSAGPDFTEPGGGEGSGTPRVRILPLPTARHNAPRIVLVVDREPASSDPVTREMWSRVSNAIGAVTMILDSRTIDLPQVDGGASGRSFSIADLLP